MTPCGPIHKNLLRLIAIAFLATSAFTQAPPKYDPATETRLKGVVEQLKLVPLTRGKPVAYLVIKSDHDTVQVFLCPKTFLDEMGVGFKPGDDIQVTGSKVKQDGAELILAREVVKGEDTLTLRFKDGRPTRLVGGRSSLGSVRPAGVDQGFAPNVWLLVNGNLICLGEAVRNKLRVALPA